MAAATEYATIIRELFAPAAPATTDRAAAGVMDSARVSLKAAEGVTASEQLNIELEANLSSTDPGERAEAATQLLAKVLTDLEVSAFLKTVADEEEAPMRSPAIAADRSARVPDVEEYLGIILRTKPGLPLAERATRILPDIPTARQKLSEAAEDSVALIVERALELAKTSFGRLASLGFAEVFKAAGVVGSGIADALGVSGKLSALYRLGRDFILKAYNALTSLLGD